MKFRAAIALLALAVPAVAQRGGAHGGSFGGPGSASRGSAGHAGFSGPSGFSRSTGSVRPAQPFRYGTPGTAGFRQMGPPNYSNFRIPYNGYGSPAARPPNRLLSAQPSSARYPSAQNRTSNRTSNRGGNSNGDLFAARRRSFNNRYFSNYPTWPGYGYPYLIEPGFYDWDDSDNSAPDNSAYDQSGAAPYYPAPDPDYGYGAPGEIPSASAQGQQRAAAEPTAPSAPEQPLTVIFKSGRDPVKMQNYMMTSKVLTDLDSRHYEQIPIDQIDIAATQWANSAVGVRFEIPDASRD